MVSSKKIGMSRYYDKSNTNQPVTLLKVSNCKVVSVINMEKTVISRLHFPMVLLKKQINPLDPSLKEKSQNLFLEAKNLELVLII